MNRPVSLLLIILVSHALTSLASDNPFLSRYGTPFETPPFERIRVEHYFPAFVEGMAAEKREVAAIIDNARSADFANTIVALDRSGSLLGRVSAVFGAVRGANTNDQLDSLATLLTPMLTNHRNDISLNEKLFQRVKAVYDRRKSLRLAAEDSMLLENTYKDFVRGGAGLSPEGKTRLRALNQELSMLSLRFNQNVLKETNGYRLVVDREADLAGLPAASVGAAAEAAKGAGLEGKWVFTLQKPSLIPFLQYARNRDLREKIYRAYCKRADNGDALDNNRILSRIASLRVARAQLLGYPTHADYVLEENMARDPKTVLDFLHKLWTPATAVARREREAMQEMIVREEGSFSLAPWDWWYYAEKVKKARYDLDEDELRPYFRMENVRNGAFDVAARLFGLQFIECADIPRYAGDVQVFEVRRTDGTHLGVLYTDYYPRAGKRPGAWMGSFRSRERIGDSIVTPIVYNVGNFSRPAGDRPALLSLDEVETLFHEFGHGLFGLLSGRTYRNLGLPRDGIELPSQIMENWAFTPEVLRSYAVHYQTGAVIPDSLIEKIRRTETFNQGFASVEYLAASFLDMEWHTLKDTAGVEPARFEKALFERLGLIPEILPRYRSSYFAHIFSGGYSAGYYSYIWAEVLDSDAFEAFKEKGLFDRATARAFRENILERGGTADPMGLYVRFRGKAPSTEPLLRKRGLL